MLRACTGVGAGATPETGEGCVRVLSTSAALALGNSEVVCPSRVSGLRATGVGVVGRGEAAGAVKGSDLRIVVAGGTGDSGGDAGATSGPDGRAITDEADAAGALAEEPEAAGCL